VVDVVTLVARPRAVNSPLTCSDAQRRRWGTWRRTRLFPFVGNGFGVSDRMLYPHITRTGHW